jgi:AIG2-like family
MSSFVYFAYGSNMLLERLAARCPSARRLGIVIAGGHTVDFSKRGADGSGKAALVRHAKRATFGVLFEIALCERDALDRYEGPGYQRVDDFQVLAVSGLELVSASTYLPCASEPDLMPYDWYLQLVVAGCEQSLFPGAYTDRLRRIAFMADPEPARGSAREARAILSRHGTEMSRAGANGAA